MKKLVILGLLLALSITGCKTKETAVLDWKPNEEIREHITEVVQDADRQKAMLTIMDSFDAEMRSIAEDVKAQRAKIVEANADYDTSRADLEKMNDVLSDKVGQLSDAAKTHRFKLRDHCSEAEWKKIFAHTKGNELKYF